MENLAFEEFFIGAGLPFRCPVQRMLEPREVARIFRRARALNRAVVRAVCLSRDGAFELVIEGGELDPDPPAGLELYPIALLA